ncbi:protein of unknown function [Pseudidiomarina planktonica]|uniref:DUF4124 domain-containing protein n=2 Tax=Pseudidiomarina planktonica TaxID=1323738 RepID=A0A1Y6FX54_9GAMM|nr:protein of unknown function [Pseudidiomarina planktonica]
MLAVSTLFFYPAVLHAEVQAEAQAAEQEQAQADPQASTDANPQIYKSIDAQGRVRYSDQPSSAAVPVEVELTPTTTRFTPVTVPQLSESNAEQPDELLNQVSLSIIEPTAEEAVRANNGDVSFRWSVEAQRLSSSLVFQLILDGNLVYQGVLPQTTLQNLNRGEHEYQIKALLSERMTDGSNVEDAVVATTEPQIFYLQRHSRLFPNGN